MSVKGNKLYYGDNLDILQRYIPDNFVDLVYLDPPFNSDEDYNILFKEKTGQQSAAQIQAFSDTWHWDNAASDAYNYLTSNDVTKGIADLAIALEKLLGKNDLTAYLFMMATRLIQLHRVLKPTGSLFLHCDPTASHYLKIILDTIFGPRNFRNEIIWRRTGQHGSARKFDRIHDVILFYSKTDDYYFKVLRRPYMKGHVDSRYSLDASGKMKFVSGGNVLTGPGITQGDSGKIWRGFDPTAKNRHWAVPKFLTDQMPPEFAKLPILEKLERLYKKGLIEINEGAAWPVPLRYLEENDGQPLSDIWSAQPYTQGMVYGNDKMIDEDVLWLGPTAPERLGYQTQKPLGLLERIINSACPDGGVVLDPFCGCGTAVDASENLQRNWIGIDITWLAINLVKSRLNKIHGSKFVLEGEPKDIGAARELAKDRYQFQWWALSLINARPVGGKPDKPREGKKGADQGIDGWLRFWDGDKVESIVVQVKSGHVSVRDIRELTAVVEKQKAAMGIFITLLDPTSEMMKEIKTTDPYLMKTLQIKFPKIQIVTIEQLLRGIKLELPETASPFQQAMITKRVSNHANYRLDDHQMRTW